MAWLTPLTHEDVLNVIDHLAARNVIVDNVTTNGVAMTTEVATRRRPAHRFHIPN